MSYFCGHEHVQLGGITAPICWARNRTEGVWEARAQGIVGKEQRIQNTRMVTE